MPPSIRRLGRWVAAAVFVTHAIAAEEGADTAGGATLEGDDSAAHGDKGDGHVDFSIDPLAASAIGVAVLPGDSGAQINGKDRRGGDVSFRVFVRPDGGVEVNGEQLAACDPTRGCRLSIVWCPDSGTIVAQVADATGAVRAGQYALARPPDEIHVTAAEILSLVVMR